MSSLLAPLLPISPRSKPPLYEIIKHSSMLLYVAMECIVLCVVSAGKRGREVGTIGFFVIGISMSGVRRRVSHFPTLEASLLRGPPRGEKESRNNRRRDTCMCVRGVKLVAAFSLKQEAFRFHTRSKVLIQARKQNEKKNTITPRKEKEKNPEKRIETHSAHSSSQPRHP